HVELRPSQGAGTIAEIMLPNSVFRPIGADDQQLPVVPAPQGNGQAVTGQPGLGGALFQPAARSAEPELLAPAAAAPEATPGAPGTRLSDAELSHAELSDAELSDAELPHAEPADPMTAGGPADDTMVLPIFEEVNGWFCTENPVGMDPEEP